MKESIGRILNTIAYLRMIRGKHIKVGSGTTLNYRKVRTKSGVFLRVGCDSNINAKISFDREGAKVTIGDRTFIGDSSIVSSRSVEIGDDVLISWGCTIVDHDSHSLNFSERKDDVLNWNKGIKIWEKVKANPVQINSKVWMGFNVIVLEGVQIGEGAVIAAGSIVTKDVEPWTLSAGIPARAIRRVK